MTRRIARHIVRGFLEVIKIATAIATVIAFWYGLAETTNIVPSPSEITVQVEFPEAVVDAAEKFLAD